MAESVLFVALPYAALAVMIVGLFMRFGSPRYAISSLSSQLLEDRALLYGTIPWHFGILVLLFGHLIPFALPDTFAALTRNHGLLLALEAIGFAAGLSALLGLLVLIARRLLVARLRTVTSPVDGFVLLLLLAQVVLGLGVAAFYRWGAAWSTVTVAPYLWSLARFDPQPALVADLPPVMVLHLVGAWALLALAPFSRLIHAFVWPLGILVRAPQRVVWSTARVEPGQPAASTLKPGNER